MSNKLSIDDAYNLWKEWGGTGYSSSRALRQAMREKRYGTQGKYYWQVDADNLREYLNYVKSRGNVKMTTTAATASTRFNASISKNSRQSQDDDDGELPIWLPPIVKRVKPEWSWQQQVKHGDRQSNEWGRV